MISSVYPNARRHIDEHEIAQLSAMAINTQDYVSQYIDALSEIIGCNSYKILDTACGIGFPSIELWSRGFSDITACDGDGVSIEYLKKQFADRQIRIGTVQCPWDMLSRIITDKFDVILNVGNSFVYMDGWRACPDSSRQIFCSKKENIEKRSIDLLRNFHDVLRIGGKAIVGLAKHYEPGILEGPYNEPSNCVIQPVIYNDSKFIWSGRDTSTGSIGCRLGRHVLLAIYIMEKPSEKVI